MTRYLQTYLLRKNIFCALLLIQVILSGCGTVAVIDKNQSDLMPKSVAMSIFEKYGLKQWAEKPFMSNIGSFCGTEREFIEFNQIDSSCYSRKQNKLIFGYLHRRSFLCPSLLIYFDNVTESQALELTNAARALGASKIEKLQWAY